MEAKKSFDPLWRSECCPFRLIDEITSNLKEEGLEYITLGGVIPNPLLSKVREGIELCQKEHVDFILAVGGGSVIDSSKAIGYGVANPNNDVWDFCLKKLFQPAVCHWCHPYNCSFRK